ncbi:MAG: SNF2-related protein [Phycisphaerales bacterium JB039]
MTSAPATSGTIVAHATWTGEALLLWGESASAWRPGLTPADGAHPFAASAETLAALLGEPGPPTTISLRLPATGPAPLPSDELAHAGGHDLKELGTPDALAQLRVPAVRIGPDRAGAALERLIDAEAESEDSGLTLGASVKFFAQAARLGRQLMAQQRFVPSLRQGADGALRGSWQPWLADAASASRAAALLGAMPPVARAGAEALHYDAWATLDDFVARILDGECRAALIADDFAQTVAQRDPADPHVAWLRGLLGPDDTAPVAPGARTEVVRAVRRWTSHLEERGASATWRLALRLGEPAPDGLPADMTAPGADTLWPLTFHLRAADAARAAIDARDIWALTTDTLTIDGRRLDNPQELLLGELGRAARLYPRLESALDEPECSQLKLTTRQAYEFLREFRPVLAEQGVEVEAPEWWDAPSTRLGARLKIFSDPLEAPGPGAGAPSGAPARLGLNTLVSYQWEFTIGGATLSLEEFEELASMKSPLLRIGGQWVEARPEDVRAAMKFIRANPGGQMPVLEAMRLAYEADGAGAGVPIVGLEAQGWVQAVFGGADENAQLPPIEPPATFRGELRPYQLRGLRWMAFLEQFGLGACLADDMGLGKTIQLLALLAHEREAGAGAPMAPTLLVVPMSVLGNWMHEAQRFTPHLRLLVHHGAERAGGEDLIAHIGRVDVVVTTYALAHRDRDTLERIGWRRIVLDEAQFIKNPAAKQAQAVRSIAADHRVALTGTPVENRLSELWSIMDFLNPGYLGSGGGFRKRFSVPIERFGDQRRASQLRALVRPFVLRRLKTDPGVAADLPEKIESREWAPLTSEQAQLYEQVVSKMLREADRLEGIHRRGTVLAALIKLKQICNHPSQLLRDHDFDGAAPPDIHRSGKCVRIVEMLDEALSAGDQALVFTQFRQMGRLLCAMLRHELGRDVLFLHGGTPQGQRVRIVKQFQEEGAKAPILVASLKAGGVGLNLTAATHVFHFDRWWNPAVENQATDRAYRIGQSRAVMVHKFVVRGTLEERIDEMIETKTELAEQIVGAGERWLTELDTGQLRDLLRLRADAVSDDE